ncbi:MAG: 2-C-methyl-D-erythritol 4-phosphate cytidylyltransferase [Planctomycetes bacterium]|nr:2-C-methyl-D-erythritol 4-phosphate cytidylyltransferase [Planctomycetota bacterium]
MTDDRATPPHTCALVVAAGGSTRMGSAGERKPFLEIAGRSVLERACAAFDAAEAVRTIVIVGRAEDLERIRALAARSSALRKVRRIVPGGAERTDSVRAGLAAADPAAEFVAVHDAARPLVSRAVVERALELAVLAGAALTAVPIVDTVKESQDGRHASATLDRARLWAAQTPQVFRRALLAELLERAARDGFRPTDEAALHERYVGPVPMSRGSRANQKLTTPEDLPLLEALARLAAAEEQA